MADTFDTVSAQIPATVPTSQLNNLLHAYQTGVMKPADAAQFESDVHSGLIALPPSVHIGGKPNIANPETVQELPSPVINAYNKAAANPWDPGAMDYTSRKQLDKDLANGVIKLGKGQALNQQYLGLTGNAKELVTGELRSTDATRNNPDYTYMPEFSKVDLPTAKAALGTLAATGPKEIAQIIKAQFPNVGITQDEKGNYLFKSGVNGNTYALKPGASIDDLAKGIGAMLAFTPAGRAESIVGAGLANAATQTGIEAVKAGTGGDFNAASIPIAAGIGAAIPAAGKIVDAGKALLSPGAKTAEEVAPVAAQAVETAPKPAPASPEVPLPGTAPMAPREGGSLSWRTSNPGNIKDGDFARANGAVGSKDGFAVFPDDATGRAAQEKLLFDTSGYKNLTLNQAIKKYAPAADGNDTVAYIKAVAKDSGVSPAKPMSAMTAKERGAVLDAMQTHEGWKPGTGEVASVGTKIAEAVPPKPELLPSEDLGATARTAAMDGLGSNNAKQVLAEQAAPSPKTLEAAKRLGIEDNLQPDHISTNQAYRQLTQVIKSIPGSELGAQSTQGLINVAKRADDLITELGGTKDLSVMSNNVQNTLAATQQRLEKEGDRLYKDLRGAIPNQAPVEADNVLGFINQRAQDLGGVENLSPLERTIYRKLTPKEVDATAPQVEEGAVMSSAEYRKLQASIDAVKNGQQDLKQPTYALLDDVRKSVGDALYKKAGVFKDAPTGILKKLYTGLTQDQGVVAEQHGVKELWDKAKATVEMRKGIEDDLTSLFGKQIDKSMATNAKNSVANLDGPGIIRLLKHVPEELRKEVVASGLVAAFQKGSRSGAMNFNGYARWYEGLLKNKQAYHAIMSNLPPEARKQLSDLYRVSNGISLSEKEFLRTGKLETGVKVLKDAMTTKPEGLVNKLYEVAGHVGKQAGRAALADVLGGHGAAMGVAAISAIRSAGKTDVLKAVDHLLASPEFENAAKKMVTGQTKQGATMLAYSKPFLRLTRALGSPREMTNKERWIMQALEAGNNNNN